MEQNEMGIRSSEAATVQSAYVNAVHLCGRVTQIKFNATVAEITLDCDGVAIRCIAYREIRSQLLAQVRTGDWLRCFANIQSHSTRDGKSYPPSIVLDEVQWLTQQEAEEAKALNTFWVTGQLLSVRQTVTDYSLCRVQTLRQGRISQVSVYIKAKPQDVLAKSDGICITLAGSVQCGNDFLADGTMRIAQYYVADEVL